jgi:hypothetical protein
MNGVGVVSFCDDASGDLDLSHVSLDLDGDHVVAGRSDLTADGDRPDLRARLDAQRDRLERDLDALDKALALTAFGVVEAFAAVQADLTSELVA